MMFSKLVRFTLTVGIVLLIVHTSEGQSYADNALLFSRTRPAGSARIQALGGTQISLGGDYSSALSNPAGLGMYNHSEFTFSLANTSLVTDVNYFGNSTSTTKSTLNVPGLSYVSHHETGKTTGFLGGSFAVTLSRINDLNSDYTYYGTNSESSIIDYFIDDASGRDPDEMLSGGYDFYNITALAYNNYLIDYNWDEGTYGSVLSPLPADPGKGIPAEVRTVDQRETIKRRGKQYQWSLAYGANFSDNFFLGASLGITTLRYRATTTFEESNLQYDQSSDYNPIDSYRLEEYVDVQGSGVNFNLGMIYRPVDFIQLGASFSTPTVYQLTESYDAGIFSRWNNFDYNGDGSRMLNNVSEQFDALLSEYNLRTPVKFSTGATLISKYGFISGDVEFINYGKAKYSSDISDISYDADNDDVKSAYTSVVNYRVGAEFRYNIFRVRGGYNVMADPYRRANDVDRQIQSISGGLGVKLKTFFVDAAVVSSKTDGRRIPYGAFDLPDPIANQKIKNTNIVLTVGFTFDNE